MNSYLLLRNNKETGPYSLEDLLRAGLKPYDLVWVKDRSAAWRYPSEIDELRSHAPVVEEQPYDRFYKRPGEQEPPSHPALQQARLATAAMALNPELLNRSDNTRVKPIVPVGPSESPLVAGQPAPSVIVPQVPGILQPAATSSSVQSASVQNPYSHGAQLHSEAIQSTSAQSTSVQSASPQSASPQSESFQSTPVQRASVQSPSVQSSPVQSSAVETRSVETPAVDSPYAPKPSHHQTVVKPARSVFVTMPAGTNSATHTASAIPSPSPRNPVKETIDISPAGNQHAADTTVNAGAAAVSPLTGGPTINERAMAREEPAQVRYSQPLDEIKERYVQTLQERKQKLAKSDWLKSAGKKAAVIVGLLGVGLLAGFMMRSTGAERQTASNSLTPSAVVIPDSVVREAELNAETPGEEQSQPAAVSNNEEITEPVAQEPVQSIPATHVPQELPGIQPAAVPQKSKTDQTSPEQTRRQVLFDENKFAKNNSIVNPETGERTRQSRDENTGTVQAPPAVVSAPVKTAAKSDWGGQVTVASNDYKRVAFGGIRNLQLTVTNHGKKELENVVVELTYLKPSEEPLRSEQVRFKNVAPGSSSTIRVPDTNRGIKVTYKIVQVIGAGNEAVAGN